MRQYVREGFRDLVRARSATAIAWLASFAAALSVEVALRSAAFDLKDALGGGGIGALFHAQLVVLFGAAVGSLLLDSARSLALTAYAHPNQPFLALGMTRVPALITLTAVEITVEGFLLFGLALTLPRVMQSPGAAALLCAPVMFLFVILFLAARIGLVLAARGIKPAPALAHGFDVVMRRFPSLVRLSGAILLYTLPLLLLAGGLRVVAGLAPESLSTIIARSLSLALFELAALIGYASLANLVGRDARLTTG